MVDDWRLALDSKKVTGSIAIDLSKAFDSICHNFLLAKLSAYGVSDEATRFLHSYLSDRKQKVKVNGVLSDWQATRASLRLYANDTTTYASDTNTAALELSLNQDLQKLSSWFSSNHLSINHNKTKAMFLGKSSDQPVFHLSDSPIDIKDSLKILGVLIDNKLSFKEHISAVIM
ncbi:uncharacterized protein LOC144644915 [Oculina patagonica]